MRWSTGCSSAAGQEKESARRRAGPMFPQSIHCCMYVYEVRLQSCICPTRAACMGGHELKGMRGRTLWCLLSPAWQSRPRTYSALFPPRPGKHAVAKAAGMTALQGWLRSQLCLPNEGRFPERLSGLQFKNLNQEAEVSQTAWASEPLSLIGWWP